MGHLVPRLQREPTEIFSEQCFVTMEAGEGAAFAQIADAGLAHTVTCGGPTTPTTTAPIPERLKELEDTFDDIGHRDLLDDVLYTNARRFMGLND